MIYWEITVILNVPLVPIREFRPMKPLFFPLFLALTVVLLTVAVRADQYVVRSDMPMSERIIFRDMPVYAVPNSVVTVVSDTVYVGERIVTPMSYTMPYTVSHTVARPPETPITVPEPLVLIPFSPIQERPPVAEITPPVSEPPLSVPLAPVLPETVPPPTIVRGQQGTEGVADILDNPPPLPRGAVEADAIDPKLIDSTSSLDSDLDALAGLIVSNNPQTTTSPGQTPDTVSTDPVGNAILVLVTIFTTLGLLYMAFLAYDYHQRWIHSMTAQNDRYIGGAVDMDVDDMYGGSFSDNFGFSDSLGLARRPI